MARPTVLAIVGLALAGLVRPVPAAAQCAMPMKKLPAAVDGKLAYDAARAQATRWKADSALIRMQATSAGPLSASGQAAHWMLEFYSKDAKKLQVVNIMSGEMNCSAADVPQLASEPVEVGADTLLDTRRLYDLAQQAGGSAQAAKNPRVVAMLEKKDTGGVWTVTYVSAQGMPLLTVKIDAKTGAVIK